MVGLNGISISFLDVRGEFTDKACFLRLRKLFVEIAENLNRLTSFSDSVIYSVVAKYNELAKSNEGWTLKWCSKLAVG